MTYKKQLENPLWQKKRLDVLNAAGWRCLKCGDTRRTLHVHHINYGKGKKPWAYPDQNFLALCVVCHEWIESEIRSFREKIAGDIQQKAGALALPSSIVEDRHQESRALTVEEMRSHFDALRKKLGLEVKK